MNASEPYVGDTSRSPIVTCAIGSIVCAFLAVGIEASYLPKSAPLAWPIAFLGVSGVLSLATAGLLMRLRQFAWQLFFAVARWVLVLTSIFAAMAMYVFIADGTGGTQLTILVIVLLLAALNIPMLLGFSVARHERVFDELQPR